MTFWFGSGSSTYYTLFWFWMLYLFCMQASWASLPRERLFWNTWWRGREWMTLLAVSLMDVFMSKRFIILTLEHGKKFFGGRFIGYAIFLYASVGAHISWHWIHTVISCAINWRMKISHLHKRGNHFQFYEQPTQHVTWLALCTVSSEAVWCASSSVPGRRVWGCLPPQTVSKISGASCRQHTGIHDLSMCILRSHCMYE